ARAFRIASELTLRGPCHDLLANRPLVEERGHAVPAQHDPGGVVAVEDGHERITLELLDLLTPGPFPPGEMVAIQHHHATFERHVRRLARYIARHDTGRAVIGRPGYHLLPLREVDRVHRSRCGLH